MTDEKRRPRPAAQYGPTGDAVARNLKDLREARGLTIYGLSGALNKAGRPITPSAIAKIEKKQRQVSVDDLMALAIVLNVNPSALLFPRDDSPGTIVELLPGRYEDGGEIRATAWHVWQWADGETQLFDHPDAEKSIDARIKYIQQARPPRRGRVEMARALQEFHGAEGERPDGTSVD
ncbi:helix-turn-helix domain-containing protein [Streptomyces sp. CCM_MD2014]|uniref:helix-turn-helix domain-containing protein n=1 Tax=Streptomyces sp. CCM_MD2014 TaxID=1561022 RepID=UPI00130E5EDD|nr:helix-turn-helix transcriptional regulator [Streptomyces sp. CCM_MD2014]